MLQYHYVSVVNKDSRMGTMHTTSVIHSLCRTYRLC